MSFPHLDGEMLLRNRSQVLGSEHAGHPRGSPGQGHLPRPLLVHLLHHLAIDELPLLLTGSQRPAQSLSIFEIIVWGNFPTVKTCLPKSHKMPDVSPRKPDTNKGFSKHFTAVCHSPHEYKLHKTRQTASLKRLEALCAMSCPACLCPELQILTTGGTRTRDAYSLLANTTMLITCVPTKSLLDGHGHDHATHCSVL